MPTPFTHLQISEEIRRLASKDLHRAGNFYGILVNNWPAFYFGAVAPDYQTISGIARAETHFYGLPPESRHEAQEKLLAYCPQLFPGRSIPPEQAAFFAAYLIHLQVDIDWHYEVVLPYFVAQADRAADPGDRHRRYLRHLVLLTYLDKVALESLPSTAACVLAAADPDHWLPFADESELVSWRDFLVDQLNPGGNKRTIEIFAGRLQMTPEAFAAKLDDLRWMEDEVFSRLPVMEIQQRLLASVPAYLDLANVYWHGRLD